MEGWSLRWLVALVVLVVSVSGLAMWGCPQYGVYERTLKGESELKQAQWNRQIAVQEANAKMEAAKLLAEADTIRAHGVAASNRIIGQSLKENEAYLTWLWIESLKEGKNDVIYVPTEGQLPILETQRFQMRRPHE